MEAIYIKNPVFLEDRFHYDAVSEILCNTAKQDSNTRITLIFIVNS